MPKTDQRICVGAIAGAHGLRGQVLIKYFTQFPEAIASLGKVETGDGARQFTLRISRNVKDGVVASLSGVADRNAAEALRGIRLYVPRSALPELAAAAGDRLQGRLPEVADLQGVALVIVAGLDPAESSRVAEAAKAFLAGTEAAIRA